MITRMCVALAFVTVTAGSSNPCPRIVLQLTIPVASVTTNGEVFVDWTVRNASEAKFYIDDRFPNFYRIEKKENARWVPIEAVGIVRGCGKSTAGLDAENSKPRMALLPGQEITKFEVSYTQQFRKGADKIEPGTYRITLIETQSRCASNQICSYESNPAVVVITN